MADTLEAKGIKFKYETGVVRYQSPVRGGQCTACGSKKVGKTRTYTPDFRVGPIILETKGKLTSAERTKFIAIAASNPGLDLRLVFQRDNKLRRNSITRYSDWARDHGFKFYVGLKLPVGLVKELKKCANSEQPTSSSRTRKSTRSTRSASSNTSASTSQTDNPTT